MRFCSTCGSRFSNDARYCPVDGQPTVEVPDERPAVDSMIGRTVDGRYHVERAVGEGGMGVVYLATHVALQKRFALKVLRGEMAKDPEVVQRFVQEAQSSSAIGHPNIVDISDFGRLPDGAFYFVMEYLDGETLTSRITRTNGLTVAESLPILEMLTSSLGAAHDRGIVHRDLKPDNVFLVRRGASPNFVKVLDFGIAKVGGAASKLTRTGMIFGTPHYMSPEQAAGQAVDRRTDIYALGVIMYEMVTGHVPFDADTFMGILSKHMFEAPRRPTELVPGQDLGALEPIIMRALVKKPEERYQSMEAVHRDLMTVASGGRIAAFTAPTNPIEFRASASGSMPPPRASSRPPSLPSRHSSLQLFGGVALVLLALGGLAGATVHFLGMASSTDAATAPVIALPSLPVATPTPPASAPAVASPTPASTPTPSRVHVESTPPFASVFSGDSIVGTTPLDLPRPSVGEQSFEVRLDGHATRTITLSSASTTPLVVTLERGSSRDRIAASTPDSTGPTPARTTTSNGTSRPPERTSTMVPPSTPVEAPMAEPPRPPPTRAPPDVLDPWQ